MKRAFVRGLWGNLFDDSDNTTERRGKILRDVSRVLNSEHKIDFVTYVFGKENNIRLQKGYGLNTRLIDDNPIAWDMKRELYRHKLEVLRYAMEDYDEIVFLDWDCILKKQMSIDFWDKLNEKAVIQANLFQYRTKKCLWRSEDIRKTCNGGFIYLRNESIPDELIANWNEFKVYVDQQREVRQARGLDLRLREKSLIFDDEPAMSKYIDDYCGGWPGTDVYWDRFEPSVCNLRKKSVYENKGTKDMYFMHML